jgi:phage shock protein A
MTAIAEQLKQENISLRRQNRELHTQIGELLTSGNKMLKTSHDMLATQTKLYETISLIASCSTMQEVHEMILNKLSEIELVTRMNLPTAGVN